MSNKKLVYRCYERLKITRAVVRSLLRMASEAFVSVFYCLVKSRSSWFRDQGEKYCVTVRNSKNVRIYERWFLQTIANAIGPFIASWRTWSDPRQTVPKSRVEINLPRFHLIFMLSGTPAIYHDRLCFAGQRFDSRRGRNVLKSSWKTCGEKPLVNHSRRTFERDLWFRD